MEYYTHIWKLKDTGKTWNPEPDEVCDPASSLDGAIDTYHQDEFGAVSYVHTLVTDSETGASRQIDIEEEIDHRKYMDRSPAEIAWDRGCDEYHAGRDE